MKIIAVNAGSSSLKFQLLEMPTEEVLVSGVIERIGDHHSLVKMNIDGKTDKEEIKIEDHAKAVDVLLHKLLELKVLNSIDEIDDVGHRVVHGGEHFNKSVTIDDQVLKAIKEVSDLAPLHNPANLTGILAFQKVLPHIKGVAVFDTAFHQTMPKESYLYGVPYDWYKKYSVRKYGFHGTSHQYVATRTAELLNKNLEEVNTIVLHLGNGASICAIEGGKSVDTSMGFTPLAGIMMGTRSGDIDPAIVQYICKKENKSIDEVLHQLNKESGYLGMSNISNDSRDVWKSAYQGTQQSLETIKKHVKMICDYIAAYYVTLKRVDAISFTAGVGENAVLTRQLIGKRLEPLGVKIDDLRNQVRGEEALISSAESKIKVFLIPTNEEVMIARDTQKLHKKG
jgi:acetate kinase